MLAIFAVALAMWFMYISDSLSTTYGMLFQAYQSKTRQLQMIRTAEELTRYEMERGAYPATLAALASTSGFHQVSGLINNWQGYGVSPAIVDSNWTFKRSVLFTNDPTTGTTGAAYLAANACGTGGYSTALSWCGSKTSFWFRQESRNNFNERIVSERARMNRLSQKFANYYNGFATYPISDASNVAFAAGSIASLADLVGYAGTAANCNGQYQYKGIPIDCGDMFNSWGMKVGYQFESASHIILVSETPIVNASGVTVIVAIDLVVA